jgi:AraC-like DNA-binding protein/quercetin dioxygenase-like cupin family protein
VLPPAARSTNREDYQNVPRPVVAMAKEFPSGSEVLPHSHPRAQLVYAVSGMMRVAAHGGGGREGEGQKGEGQGGAWVVPPLRGVWIPPETVHEIRMVGEVAMRTLYIAPDAAPGLPRGCVVIEVSSLLRELILGMAEEPIEYPVGGRAEMMAKLILSELQAAPTVPLGVTLPADERLRRLCRALLDDPGSDATLESWAAEVGASSRTLVRRFRSETGLSFGEWRQQARLAEAVSLLALGRPVGEVARRLGYGSPAAFTAMFRRALGDTPKRYLDPARRGSPELRT